MSVNSLRIDHRAPRGFHLYKYDEDGGFDREGRPEIADDDISSNEDCLWELVGEHLQKQGVFDKINEVFSDGEDWPEYKLCYWADGTKVTSRFTLFSEEREGKPVRYSYLFGKRTCGFDDMCGFIKRRDRFFYTLEEMLECLWTNHLQSMEIELFDAFSRYAVLLALENVNKK